MSSRSIIDRISSTNFSEPVGCSDEESPNQADESGMCSRSLAIKLEEERTLISRSAAPEESRSIFRNQCVSPSDSLSLRKLISARSGSIPSAIQRIRTGRRVF